MPLIAAGATLLGGIIGGNSAKRAAQTQANAQLEAARIAADAQRFRPVGVTTRFGSSNFQTDAQGNLIGAGYNVSPEVAMMRDRLLSQAGGQGFQTAEQAQAAQERLFNLGQQFLPTSADYAASPEAQAYAQQLRGLSSQVMPTSYDPTAAAQQYVQQQQALLAPSREKAAASLTQNLFNTGRGGVAVAQGGTMGAANPELQALLNAQAAQDAELAARGTALGRQYLAEDIRLGAGLGADALSTQQRAEEIARQQMLGNLQTGTGLFGTGLDLASSAYNPFKTQFGLAQSLESSGQGALDLGAQLGGRAAQAGGNVGNTLMTGATNAANSMYAANSYSPLGDFLSGAASNKQLMAGLSNWMRPSSGTFQADPNAYAFGTQSWE